MTKILIDEATVKLALEALETVAKQPVGKGTVDAITALQEALAAQPAQQEPVGRTDRQIVDQTEELAVWLLSWGFSRQPETLTPMRETRHPMAERCWSAACHIQEMLTATDPENSVAELDDAPQAQPAPEIAIADAYRAGVDSGIAAEREACAGVCDDWAKTSYLSEAKSCAKIIRARGKTHD